MNIGLNDIDIEILQHLTDAELYNVCISNKYFYNLCRDNNNLNKRLKTYIKNEKSIIDRTLNDLIFKSTHRNDDVIISVPTDNTDIYYDNAFGWYTVDMRLYKKKYMSQSDIINYLFDISMDNIPYYIEISGKSYCSYHYQKMA